MANEPSASDRVWAAIINQGSFRFKIGDVRRKVREMGAESDELPSNETIRRRLRAAEELGVVEHTKNSPYYRLE